jgi:hypothetical protein
MKKKVKKVLGLLIIIALAMIVVFFRPPETNEKAMVCTNDFYKAYKDILTVLYVDEDVTKIRTEFVHDLKKYHFKNFKEAQRFVEKEARAFMYKNEIEGLSYHYSLSEDYVFTEVFFIDLSVIQEGDCDLSAFYLDYFSYAVKGSKDYSGEPLKLELLQSRIEGRWLNCSRK